MLLPALGPLGPCHPCPSGAGAPQLHLPTARTVRHRLKGWAQRVVQVGPQRPKGTLPHVCTPHIHISTFLGSRWALRVWRWSTLHLSMVHPRGRAHTQWEAAPRAPDTPDLNWPGWWTCPLHDHAQPWGEWAGASSTSRTACKASTSCAVLQRSACCAAAPSRASHPARSTACRAVRSAASTAFCCCTACNSCSNASPCAPPYAPSTRAQPLPRSATRWYVLAAWECHRRLLGRLGAQGNCTPGFEPGPRLQSPPKVQR